MIGLHRDPRGTTLFRGHAIRSSSTGSPSQAKSLRKYYVQQIENLRRRVRELESLTNQPCTTTESSRETELRVESVNPLYMDKEGGTRDDREHLPGEEPVNDDMESADRASASPREGQSCAGDCLEQGTESNGTVTEREMSRDKNVISDISHENSCCSTPQDH